MSCETCVTTAAQLLESLDGRDVGQKLIARRIALTLHISNLLNKYSTLLSEKCWSAAARVSRQVEEHCLELASCHREEAIWCESQEATTVGS